MGGTPAPVPTKQLLAIKMGAETPTRRHNQKECPRQTVSIRLRELGQVADSLDCGQH